MMGVSLPDILCSARDIENCREYEIHEHNKKQRCDDCRSGRAPDFLRTGSGCKPLVTADSGDHQAKHNAFDEAADDVLHEKRIACGDKIASETVVRANDTEDAAAHNSHQVCPGGQAR